MTSSRPLLVIITAIGIVLILINMQQLGPPAPVQCTCHCDKTMYNDHVLGTRRFNENHRQHEITRDERYENYIINGRGVQNKNSANEGSQKYSDAKDGTKEHNVPVTDTAVDTQNKNNVNYRTKEDIPSQYNSLDIEKEPVCQIPELNPYHRSINHLIEVKEPLNCESINGHADLTYLTETGSLYINHTVLAGRTLTLCSYSYVLREDDAITYFSNTTVTKFKNGTDFRKDFLLIDKIAMDYVAVVCVFDAVENDFDSVNYEMHPGIAPNQDALNWAKISNPMPQSALDVNIIVLGLESTSHMNFLRQMPKSYQYLTEIMEAVVLEGYNIVGDATVEAMIPVLTGEKWEDLPETRLGHEGAQSVGVYPLIWKAYKERGYLTLLAEDSPHISIFNLRTEGFYEQPTDHYMRTYWLKSVDLTPDYNCILNPKHCEGARREHDVMFNYLKEFQTKYDPWVRKFGFMFVTELSHDNINNLGWADSDLQRYLKSLYEGGHLENTIHILFGDHGARYSDIRNTMQGKLEERLPFMSVFIPKKLRDSHPEMYEHLQANAEKLTTPFDIHATFKHILNYSDDTVSGRGISLFKKIPLSRTCEDAGVDTHWCTCLKWIPMSTGSMEIRKSAAAFLNHINDITEPFRKYCVLLSMFNITHAEMSVPNDKVLRYTGSIDDDQSLPGFGEHANVNINDMNIDYQVTIETIPGHALFEGTIRMDHVNNGAQRYDVTQDISRINMYGSQPKCIADKYPDIAKYCYCKDNI
uniref:Uncharacterized protein LOC100366885 n=1 Tax=Saccoglossus kowalevskii TaxID=10224 RepID=A0ABM0H116_SACKO|nr:PREDICTED: uncharacterized protein LOC100366885 [Saccoglossus kowalevskii]